MGLFVVIYRFFRAVKERGRYQNFTSSWLRVTGKEVKVRVKLVSTESVVDSVRRPLMKLTPFSEFFVGRLRSAIHLKKYSSTCYVAMGMA